MFGVVGATGRTGRVVAETLIARGAPVRVILRQEQAGPQWRERGAEVALATLEDQRDLERAFAGLDGLYAILPEDPRRPDFHAPRRRMSAAISAAVESCRVPHVVFLSTFAAALAE